MSLRSIWEEDEMGIGGSGDDDDDDLIMEGMTDMYAAGRQAILALS